jgi:hypothetical protein
MIFWMMKNLLRSCGTKSKWHWELKETQSNLFPLTFYKGRQVDFIEGKEELKYSSWLNAHIDGYEIRDVMLDLGPDINIFPKNTWEAMGKPKLVYSYIQLQMEKQYCIFPVRRLPNVEVDLAGIKIVDDFKVIEIMGEHDPYPTLLGIHWAYENYVVIDLKNETMNFESDGMKVNQPLDPYQGPWYI